jgi:hypothetical protein
MSTRLAGLPTISQKSALMALDGLTEEQADLEMERMKKDQEAANPPLADPSAFNGKASPLTNALNKKASESKNEVAAAAK